MRPVLPHRPSTFKYDAAVPTILDGPMGTELLARGVATPIPSWSAAALETGPDVVAQIHRDYVQAGATVHTTNTFRTRRRIYPKRWEQLARLAVRLAREAVPQDQRIAGSIAPLEDCYSPELSPANCREEHRELALTLADAGCDLLLCETFAHTGEGLVAVEEAVATGLETWAAFTPGPTAQLMTPAALAEAAREAFERGASTVLVNCVAASAAGPYVAALAELARPFGIYANAGTPEEGMGWKSAPETPEKYLDFVANWVEAGASVIGACCGLGPAVISAVAGKYGQTAETIPFPEG